MIHAIGTLILIAAFCFGVLENGPNRGEKYEWKNVTAAANYPQGYNYQVFVWGDKMVALNNGTWLSRDGKDWTKGSLPDSGLNSAYLSYAQFNGMIYALGSMTGNYQNFTISTKIQRTRDLENWETVAETSNLPKRIFYGSVVFGGKIWMIGGFDGKNYLNDVWNSADGVHWQQVAENAPWSARKTSVVTVFKNEIWLLGGGVIDGEKEENPTSEREVWATKNGKNWRQVQADLNRKWRGTPVVFDNKLWLVGANRGGTFESAVWMTEDGSKWSELPAPWSPRGAVAAWVFKDRLFMTGGKSSHTENGEIKFVYSNDVWAMDRKTE
ncbi:MAG TPA: hypothetical protein VK612_07480 [Pyrinomonadaceae bacterium]|nr:hypothetical protein [Pyrinomonadaceae bacterium]